VALGAFVASRYRAGPTANPNGPASTFKKPLRAAAVTATPT
jgi:hypothetical protein